MDTATPTAPVSPAVAEAFDDLTRARTLERDTREVVAGLRRTLRRFAYKHGLTLRQARRWTFTHDRAVFLELATAELTHERALRDFRRVAMIAALTRVCDTDQRNNASRAAA